MLAYFISSATCFNNVIPAPVKHCVTRKSLQAIFSLVSSCYNKGNETLSGIYRH